MQFKHRCYNIIDRYLDLLIWVIDHEYAIITSIIVDKYIDQ